MSGRGRSKKPVAELIDWEAVARQDADCRHIRGFQIKDKLKDTKYEETREVMLKTMTGRELKVEHFQRYGFTNPILVARRDELGADRHRRLAGHRPLRRT